MEEGEMEISRGIYGNIASVRGNRSGSLAPNETRQMQS